MTKREVLNGKPYAGNPHAWFDEGKVALAATPRRGSLLYNKLSIIVLSAVTAVLSLSASEPMSYNELESVSDSYWNTTGRTGVTVEVDSCEFSGGLDISPHDIQWSGDFDLCTMKRGLVFIVH